LLGEKQLTHIDMYIKSSMILALYGQLMKDPNGPLWTDENIYMSADVPG
jgi:hypothetical protein